MLPSRVAMRDMLSPGRGPSRPPGPHIRTAWLCAGAGVDTLRACEAAGERSMSSEMFGFDAFSPREIAAKVETLGVGKARLPLGTMWMLAMLAGAFIGLGALYFTLVRSDPTLGFAVAQVLGGLVFSLGLLLVVVAGAELFTGNNLLAMAWAAGRISMREVLRNWSVVCAGNLVGAAGLALLVFLSGHAQMNGGRIAETTMAIAVAKVELPFWSAFFRG